MLRLASLQAWRAIPKPTPQRRYFLNQAIHRAVPATFPVHSVSALLSKRECIYSNGDIVNHLKADTSSNTHRGDPSLSLCITNTRQYPEESPYHQGIYKIPGFGHIDDVEELQASSTLKKRRLKMNKHKYRKRKKRDRRRTK